MREIESEDGGSGRRMANVDGGAEGGERGEASDEILEVVYNYYMLEFNIYSHTCLTPYIAETWLYRTLFFAARQNPYIFHIIIPLSGHLYCGHLVVAGTFLEVFFCKLYLHTADTSKIFSS